MAFACAALHLDHAAAGRISIGVWRTAAEFGALHVERSLKYIAVRAPRECTITAARETCCVHYSRTWSLAHQASCAKDKDVWRTCARALHPLYWLG